MTNPSKKIVRDLPDVERETSSKIHNDQGSTQQMPTDSPDIRRQDVSEKPVRSPRKG
jgi:hypothetical protein